MVHAELLKLLREAVAAKVQYWDAFRALELALEAHGGELADARVDQADSLIGTYASGLNSAEQARALDATHLQHLLATLNLTPS